MPRSMEPTPIMPSAGRIVAVLGAISPASAASPGVIDGSGLADSPFDVREMGAPPPAGGPPTRLGFAIDASARDLVESPGEMSVESDIVVSAEGAPAAGGADASAAAWWNGITAAMSPAKSPPPMAFAIRLSSPPGALHWQSFCADSVAAGSMRMESAAATRSVTLATKDISTLANASGRYSFEVVHGQFNMGASS